MRFVKYFALSAMFTLLIPVSALARAKDRGTMQLIDPAEIGSTQLKPGTYLVERNGTGPTVQVSIMQHKNIVATATGELKTNDKEASQNAVVLEPAVNNSSGKQIAEIDFGNRKEALVFDSSHMNHGQ